MPRLIICGGGLSGSLAAMAVAARQPEVDLLLIEQGERFGGNHIWSFFDTDVANDCAWVLDGIARRHWDDHEVRFPKRARRIPIGYNSIRSPDLDTAVRAALRPSQYRVGKAVNDISPRHVTLAGERIEADGVIDARGPTAMPHLELGWQKFVGQVRRFKSGHGIARPMIMDATVEQIDGYRFVYLLPLDEHDLLIEDTYYSSSPTLDCPALGARIDDYAAGLGRSEAISEEDGILPVIVQGSIDDFWPASDTIPRLGLIGGFFHPTTGYSLPDAAANAALLARQQDLGIEAIAGMLRDRAARQWKDRHFYQLLNRMLFRAAEPAMRYRVLEHFYRLSPSVIGRFYAARSTMTDKLRLLSGKPPVKLRRAIAALGEQAA